MPRTESTLYPILRRMEEGKHISSYSVNYNNRIRKYFHLTDLGHEYLELFRNEIDSITAIFQFIERNNVNE